MRRWGPIVQWTETFLRFPEIDMNRHSFRDLSRFKHVNVFKLLEIEHHARGIENFRRCFLCSDMMPCCITIKKADAFYMTSARLCIIINPDAELKRN